MKARELTDGRGVDCIVEIGGPRTIVMSLSALAVDFEAMNRTIAVCPQRKRGDLVAWPLLPCFRLPIPPRPCCIDRAYSIATAGSLRYQPIQMVGGEAATTVAQRRSYAPLLVQAQRLTLASSATGPGVERAGAPR